MSAIDGIGRSAIGGARHVFHEAGGAVQQLFAKGQHGNPAFAMRTQGEVERMLTQAAEGVELIGWVKQDGTNTETYVKAWREVQHAPRDGIRGKLFGGTTPTSTIKYDPLPEPMIPPPPSDAQILESGLASFQKKGEALRAQAKKIGQMKNAAIQTISAAEQKRDELIRSAVTHVRAEDPIAARTAARQALSHDKLARTWTANRDQFAELESGLHAQVDQFTSMLEELKQTITFKRAKIEAARAENEVYSSVAGLTEGAEQMKGVYDKMDDELNGLLAGTKTLKDELAAGRANSIFGNQIVNSATELDETAALEAMMAKIFAEAKNPVEVVETEVSHALGAVSTSIDTATQELLTSTM